jgi:hypothetical protein
MTESTISRAFTYEERAATRVAAPFARAVRNNVRLRKEINILSNQDVASRLSAVRIIGRRGTDGVSRRTDGHRSMRKGSVSDRGT